MVTANAERAKDTAESYHSGDPLVYDVNEVTNRVEGAMAQRWLPPRRRSPAAPSGFLPFRSLR